MIDLYMQINPKRTRFQLSEYVSVTEKSAVRNNPNIYYPIRKCLKTSFFILQDFQQDQIDEIQKVYDKKKNVFIFEIEYLNGYPKYFIFFSNKVSFSFDVDDVQTYTKFLNEFFQFTCIVFLNAVDKNILTSFFDESKIFYCLANEQWSNFIFNKKDEKKFLLEAHKIFILQKKNIISKEIKKFSKVIFFHIFHYCLIYQLIYGSESTAKKKFIKCYKENSDKTKQHLLIEFTEEEFFKLDDIFLTTYFFKYNLCIHKRTFQLVTMGSCTQGNDDFEYNLKLFDFLQNMPFVVPCYGYIKNSKSFIFKYMAKKNFPNQPDKGPSYTANQKIGQTEKSLVMVRVLSSINWLHSQGYINRNIKPDKVFLNSRNEAFLIGYLTICKADDEKQLGNDVGSIRFKESGFDNKGVSGPYLIDANSFGLLLLSIFNIEKEPSNQTKEEKFVTALYYDVKPDKCVFTQFLLYEIEKRELFFPGTNKNIMKKFFETQKKTLWNTCIAQNLLEWWNSVKDCPLYSNIIFKEESTPYEINTFLATLFSAIQKNPFALEIITDFLVGKNSCLKEPAITAACYFLTQRMINADIEYEEYLQKLKAIKMT